MTAARREDVRYGACGWRRLLHLLFGHPRESVWWGTLAEGAGCRACGARWHRGDYP